MKQTFENLKHALEKALVEHKFVEHVQYEDALGGLVFDSYRNEERITSVVSEEGVQVLTYLGGSIASKEFAFEDDAVPNAINYLRALLE